MPSSRAFLSEQDEQWSLPSREAFLESVCPQERQFLRSTEKGFFFSCLVGIAEPVLDPREPACCCWIRPGIIQGFGLFRRPDWRINEGDDLMIKNGGSRGSRKRFIQDFRRRFERAEQFALIKNTDIERRRMPIWNGGRAAFYLLFSSLT